jgi:hypothetical protein
VTSVASASAGVAASGLATLVTGVAVGLLASRLAPSIADLAESALAVSSQQVSLAKWAHDALPGAAVIGVNDTGAMAYFGGHTTFDIVGLTTRGEAKYWTAGPGSRFEHYEHLPRGVLPTHFIVYPEWFGVDPLLGEELTERVVRHSILGGTTMAAFRAHYELLGSGDAPRDFSPAGRKLVDALDVGDLEDEASHEYALFDATSQTNVVIAGADRADGARTERNHDRFTLKLAPGGTFVARLGAVDSARVLLRVDGRALSEVNLGGNVWQELSVPLPKTIEPGPHTVHTVEVESEAGTFVSLHYWSYD